LLHVEILIGTFFSSDNCLEITVITKRIKILVLTVSAIDTQVVRPSQPTALQKPSYKKEPFLQEKKKEKDIVGKNKIKKSASPMTYHHHIHRNINHHHHHHKHTNHTHHTTPHTPPL
jgi:hypothetical protein